MLEMVVNNDEHEEYAIQPLVKTKGKGPGGWDYLTSMKIETHFLVKPKGASWQLLEFMHGGLKEGCVLLIPPSTMQNPQTWTWVDPSEFCKAFDLRTILEEPEDID